MTGASGAATGSLSFDGGTLATTASFASARTTTLNAGGGIFDIAPTTTLTLSGIIGGAGALTKVDTGTLILTANNSYTGGTTIADGTLQTVIVSNTATTSADFRPVAWGMVGVRKEPQSI